jgi:putative ABC transport system substrate-binding protein
MRRREFIGLLGGAAAALPLAVHAQQQPAMPVVGFLNTASSEEFTDLVAAFRQGLAETGYTEGHNVAIEFRWAKGRYDQLPALAADLVDRRVAVIATTGGPPSALAARAATSTIPIVFVSDGEFAPRLVASFNRPGGNITGVAMFTAPLTTKCMELLSGLLPKAATIALLVDPNDPSAPSYKEAAQRAANALGNELLVVSAGTEHDFESVFATVIERQASGLVVTADSLFTLRRNQVIALAMRHALPTIYQWREFATAGGLITYGPSLADIYRQVGIYTGRILHGDKPADLPVVQPTKFELVVNLRTAKALGLAIPPTLLAITDDVIE